VVGEHHEAAERCFALEKQESGRCHRLLLPRSGCISELRCGDETLGSPGDAVAVTGVDDTPATDEEQ
jgi:hypothetical protein